MKNYLRITTILLMACMIGCKKKADEIKPSPTFKAVDFSQVDIGKSHNDVVKRLLLSIKKNPEARIAEDPEVSRQALISALRSIPLAANPLDFAVLGITQDDFYEWISYMSTELAFYNFDVNNYPNNNPDVLKYTNEIIGVANTAESLADFDSNMEIIQNNARSELQELNLDIVTGTIQIAKSSIRLWAPVEWGGEGLVSQYGLTFRTMGGGWRGALIGDISGSAQYFMGLGAASVLGFAPGGNVVILGGWAISAGLSSAFGALGVAAIALPPKPKDIQPIPFNP